MPFTRVTILKLYATAMIALMVIQIIIYISLSFQHHIPLGRDAWSYLAAARAITAGQTPYTMNLAPFLQDAPDAPSPYLYPPLLAVLLIPLASSSLPTALTMWFGIVIAGHVLLIVALRQLVGWHVALLAVLAWPQTWNGLYYGQINALVSFMVTLAVLNYQREHYHSSAGWLVAGAMLKITPAIALLLFAARRQWRALLWSIVGTIVVVAVLLPVVDMQLWFHGVVFALTTTRSNPAYSSWGAALGHLPGLAGTIAPLGLAVVCVMFTLVRGARVPALLAFAATILVPLLVARTTWQHHAVMALPALAVLWGWSERGRWVAVLTWSIIGLVGMFTLPLMLTFCWLVCLFPHLIAPNKLLNQEPQSLPSEWFVRTSQ